MERKRNPLSEFDWGLVSIYIVLLLFGCFSIYAASYREIMASSFLEVFNLDTSFGKQLMWVGICIIMSIVCLLIDSKIYTTLAYISYGIAVVLLIAVLLFGKDVNGNKSWFGVGSFGIQPAEFAKFATALALAKYMSAMNIDIRNNIRHLITALAIIGLPACLVILQGDLGSTLVFCSFIFVLFREGASPLFLIIPFITMVISIITLKYGVVPMLIIDAISLAILIYVFRRKKFNPNLILIIVIHVVIASYALGVNTVYTNIFKDYQKARIDYVLGKYKKEKNKPLIQESLPKLDKHGKKEKKFDDWNVRQSMIAIGSGGILGKGFLKGTQTKFSFVPEQTTDFIFCTIGEEEGFWGTTLILGLYLLLLYRLVSTADKQRSTFSRIYGYSVAGILFFHFMINIGMTIGLVPVIGIPLPYISYGGSSLLAFTLLLMIMAKLDADRLHVLR